MVIPYFKSKDKAFILLQGDTIELLNQFDFKFDMIFADPPYFLSNDGISVQSGKMVSVNKGKWDRSNGFKEDNKFNYNWLKACRNHLTENGTIWVSGTFHNIFSVAQMLSELDFKILNCITWAKTNPPPNLSCKYFTHSTEFILWARKHKKKTHYYNYELMKRINGGKQMKDVWHLPAIAAWEKSCGKHPTQKPLALLTRIILASTEKNDWILDPFTGSSTTGIAANLYNRKFLGIDKDGEFLAVSKKRKLEIENPQIFGNYRKKLVGFKDENQLEIFLAKESEVEYERFLNLDKPTASPQ
jgi:site-specific DNA-methyltransferase (adenine-specific)